MWLYEYYWRLELPIKSPHSEFWSKKKGFGYKSYQTKNKPRINKKKTR